MKPTSNEQKQDERKWEQTLFQEEPDADFTLQVMQKLEDVSMESKHVQLPWAKHQAPKMKWIYRTGVAAAAVVLIAGGAWLAWDRTSVPEKPVVNAVDIPPLPNIPVPEALRYSNLADDYKRLKPYGLVVNPNIHIDDQGYVLKIEDVLVDRSQIVLNLQQTAPDGLGMYAVSAEMGRIHITDEKGRAVATLARDTRTVGSSSFGKLVFQFHQDIPDQVVVRGELGHLKLGSYYNFETKSYEDRDVTVDWSFQFKIDMTQAKTMAVETPMNNTYTTPEGMKIGLTQLVRTPNGTRLDMDVSLEDKLRAKADENWAENMNMIYYLEIPETKEYRIFNGIRPDSRQAKFRLHDQSNLSNGGPLKLSETWDPSVVTADAKKIRFVLDGYTIPVKEQEAVEVDLSKRRKDTKFNFYTFVHFEQLGDKILFYDFNYKPVYPLSKTSEAGGHSLVLEGSGTFQNAFNGDRWVAVDLQGKEYPVEVMGYPNKANSDGKYVADDLKLLIRGFYKENGTKFTLKREVVNREYRDVNWEVDLPSYSSLPWQK